MTNAHPLRSIDRFRQRFDALIRSRGAVHVTTHEEVRALQVLAQIVTGQVDKATGNPKQLLMWDAVAGWSRFPTLQEEEKGLGPYISLESNLDDLSSTHSLTTALAKINAGNVSNERRCVYVLKDIDRYLTEGKDRVSLIRSIRNTISALRITQRSLVFLSPTSSLPVEFAKDIYVMRLPLPDQQEMIEIIESAIELVQTSDEMKQCKVAMTPDDIRDLADAMAGLTADQADSVIRQGMAIYKEISPRLLPLVNAEKDAIITASGLLVPVKETRRADTGGLPILMERIERNDRHLTAKARDFGIAPPKPLLIVGMPGTGKSITATSVGNGTRKVFRMEMANLLHSELGASENHLADLFSMVETLGGDNMGVVLHIDEINLMWGQGDASADGGGTVQRMMGSLLTWLEEQTSAYIVATANSFDGLPPQFMRRFDIYFVDFPLRTARKEILAIHLRKRGRNPEEFDLDRAADLTADWTGSELEEVVNEALAIAFDRDRELWNDDLIEAIQSGEIKPISEIDKEGIERMRNGLRGNIKRAAPVAEPGEKRSGKSGTFGSVELN
jgi:SpoVK/Ycf46/Vps4 family AAA+-type ATPase